MNIKRKTRSFFLYLFLSFSAFLSIFPFFWIIIGSTNSAVDVQMGKLSFGDQLGNNLQKLFGKVDMGGALYNSAKIAVLTVLLSLLVTSMAAYGFQMYKSRAKEKAYSLFLLTMMIPFASLMIPLFQIIVVFRLLNSHTAIILVGSISVFMISFSGRVLLTTRLKSYKLPVSMELESSVSSLRYSFLV